MNQKKRSSLSAVNSTSRGERKYILEDVFWVPSALQGQDIPILPFHLNIARDTRDTSEVSNLSRTESDAGVKFR